MMDVSLGKQEKEMYIVDVRLNEAGKSYIVTYADGRQEEQDFSVHNFCAYQYRMKQQFLDNKGKFVDTMEYMKCQEIIKEFKTILYSSAALMFMSTIPIPQVLNIIIISLLGIYNAGCAIARLFRIWLYRKLRQGADNVEQFVREMEHFTIEVTDPNTGKKEDWYYYNISDANPYTVPEMLKYLHSIFTDEYKEAEGKRISKALLKFRREDEGAVK
jgi:hypothetical protein